MYISIFASWWWPSPRGSWHSLFCKHPTSLSWLVVSSKFIRLYTLWRFPFLTSIRVYTNTCEHMCTCILHIYIHTHHICVGRDWRQAAKRTWRFMDRLDFCIARSSQAQLLQRSYTTCVVGLLHGYMRQRFVFDVLTDEKNGMAGRGQGVRSGIWLCPLAVGLISHMELPACLFVQSFLQYLLSFKCRRLCSLPVLLPCSRRLLPTTSWINW